MFFTAYRKLQEPSCSPVPKCTTNNPPCRAGWVYDNCNMKNVRRAYIYQVENGLSSHKIIFVTFDHDLPWFKWILSLDHLHSSLWSPLFRGSETSVSLCLDFLQFSYEKINHTKRPGCVLGRIDVREGEFPSVCMEPCVQARWISVKDTRIQGRREAF